MFETVVPETLGTRSRRLFYETLPVSIALHAIVIGGVAATTLWTVVFPSQSPRTTVPYSLTRLPDPPPPPPPPPKAQRAAAEVKKSLPPPPPPPAVVVAPTIIPDVIPVVVDTPPAPIPEPQPVAAPQPSAAPAGGSGGAPGGVVGGEVGGKLHGVAGGLAFAEDGKVHIDRSEKLPLKVLEQEYPHYPEAARKNRLEDRVVVRYTIGTNGRVNDVTILEHAKDPMFDQETVETVKRWRFRALSIDGKKAEVVHEVEVNFQFIVR